MDKGRPNLLLVVMDTARADVFEPYGAAVGATPAVAQMASSGRTYDVVAPACWTVPSHAGMFSGLLYRTAGFGMPASTHPDYKVAGDRLTDRWLPAVLRDRGYATGGVSTNMWVSPHSGFDRGFSDYSQITGARALHLTSNAWRERARWALQALRASVDDGAEAVERLLTEWLASRGQDPFFWFVNLVECHSPYLPPKPYNRLGPLARIQAAEEARRYLNFDAIWKGLCAQTEAPDEALARMRQLYAASIKLMDDWMARILERLEQAGVLDETIVVVTSDHGENLGDNSLLGHGFSLDDRLIRVPFVVTGPALPLPQPVASLIDVPAWVAASVDLQDSPWGELEPTRQVAVAQFDAPADPGDERATATVEGWGLGSGALARLTTSFACATNGRRKLLRRSGCEELIDLDTDPLETAAVVVGPAEEATWRDELVHLRAALDRAEAEEVAGVTGAGPGSVSEGEKAALEAQMELLGYL